MYFGKAQTSRAVERSLQGSLLAPQNLPDASPVQADLLGDLAQGETGFLRALEAGEALLARLLHLLLEVGLRSAQVLARFPLLGTHNCGQPRSCWSGAAARVKKCSAPVMPSHRGPARRSPPSSAQAPPPEPGACAPFGSGAAPARRCHRRSP